MEEKKKKHVCIHNKTKTHPLASEQWAITANGIAVRRQTTMHIYIYKKQCVVESPFLACFYKLNMQPCDMV